MPMDGMMNGMGWVFMLFMLLVTLLFIAAVVAGVWLLVRAVRDGAGDPRGGGGPARRGSDGGGSRALGILEERYARGEIDHEEFAQRRRALSE
ncbi:MAG: SHOCT domain-containing protein [Actinobacteria bacterium]|nr:SHOCT domain-containing protein [Actinomycetota bacterium]